MVNETVEISSRGMWTRVPALALGDKRLIAKGKWIKVAVVHDEEWSETELADPKEAIAKLKDGHSHRVRADIFTFTQKVPNAVPAYDYPIEWESVAAAPTASFAEWWKGLPQETRKNVRRSQKRGVTIAVNELDDELIDDIISVNNDSRIRQNLPNAHYGKTFEQVKKDQSPFAERTAFICAYAGDECIGFLRMVYRGNVAAILQLLPKASHQDKRPANALLARAVELCEAKGISHLIYGLFNYGNKRDNPLREFKIRNGFTEMRIPRYYVPLTAWGRLCLKLRLHLGLHGILPHWVIMLVVRTRAKWYRLKASTGRCSLTVEQPIRNRQMECSNPPAGSSPDLHAASSVGSSPQSPTAFN
jgi:hypothetical protein